MPQHSTAQHPNTSLPLLPLSAADERDVEHKPP